MHVFPEAIHFLFIRSSVGVNDVYMEFDFSIWHVLLPFRVAVPWLFGGPRIQIAERLLPTTNCSLARQKPPAPICTSFRVVGMNSRLLEASLSLNVAAANGGPATRQPSGETDAAKDAVTLRAAGIRLLMLLARQGSHSSYLIKLTHLTVWLQVRSPWFAILAA